jgi:CRP/FNR family cyclic AMP-dependent transcriptional regulator
MENVEVLKKVFIFKSLTNLELIQFNKFITKKNFKKGRMVFQEGSQGDSLYVIKKGTVNVMKKNEQGEDEVIATLLPGDHFGEMALIDKQPRSATIVANEDCELIEVSESRFEDLLCSNKEIAVKVYKALNYVLCQRLRETTSDLATLRALLKKNLERSASA